MKKSFVNELPTKWPYKTIVETDVEDVFKDLDEELGNDVHTIMTITLVPWPIRH